MFYLTDGISRIYTSEGWEFCYQGHTYGKPVIFANYDEAIQVRDANPCPSNRPFFAFLSPTEERLLEVLEAEYGVLE